MCSTTTIPEEPENDGVLGALKNQDDAGEWKVTFLALGLSEISLIVPGIGRGEAWHWHRIHLFPRQHCA